jgi:hypothetical protein
MKVPPPPFEPNSADYKPLNGAYSPSYSTPITTANASKLDIGDYQTGQLLTAFVNAIGPNLPSFCPDPQSLSNMGNIFQIFITVCKNSLINADNSTGLATYSNDISNLESYSLQLKEGVTLSLLQEALEMFGFVGSDVEKRTQNNHITSSSQMGDLEALVTSYLSTLYSSAGPNLNLANALISLTNSLKNTLEDGINILYPVPANCINDLNQFMSDIQSATSNNKVDLQTINSLIENSVKHLYNLG